MPTLRILHLSDLHIASPMTRVYKKGFRRSVYNKHTLVALENIVNTHRIDAILISGDIADTATSKDLQLAKDFIASPDRISLKNKPGLKNSNKPVILLPGNHDRLTTLLNPADLLFDSKFETYWSAGLGGAQTSLLPDNLSPTLAIISADFSLTHVGHKTVFFGSKGQGKIYTPTIDQLVEETNDVFTNHPSCAVIWMIHFAPKFEDQEGEEDFEEYLTLIDSDLLIEKAKEVGVDRIFCGHTHRSLNYDIGVNNPIKVYCAGTSTCIKKKEDTEIHFRDIKVKDGKVVQIKSIDLKWNSDESYFV